MEYRICGENLRRYFAIMPDAREAAKEVVDRNACVGAGRSLAAPFIMQERANGAGPEAWATVPDSKVQQLYQEWVVDARPVLMKRG